MQLDKATALNNARRYALLVGQQFSPIKVILFGSYANGNWSENSDIDIAVIVDKVQDDFLEMSKMLNKLTRNIDSRIEPLLIEKDDDRSGFLSSIMLNGITLFEKPET